MGWITGVLMFSITTVIFTATMVPAASSGGISSLIRQQVRNPNDPNVQEVLRMLQSGPGIAAVLLITLVMLFIFITALAMAGGALGARVLRD
jgi:hypothetical protein